MLVDSEGAADEQEDNLYIFNDMTAEDVLNQPSEGNSSLRVSLRSHKEVDDLFSVIITSFDNHLI